MTHERVLCERCGTIIRQCRCQQPNKEIRRGLCPRCQEPRKPPTTSAHACGTVLVPVPAHMPEALARAEAICDRADAQEEFGRNEQGHACFRIDGCIVGALLAVWAAGFKTLGCCCGHGQAAGGIITIDSGTFSTTPRTGTQERYATIHAGHPDPCGPAAGAEGRQEA